MDNKLVAIVGAAGKLGFSTALKLRDAGISVRAVLRDAKKEARLAEIGCEVVLADLRDPAALGQAVANADAVQIILPASPQAENPADEMRMATESLAKALEQAQPGQMLAISDYGAHVTHDIGMATVFRAFEQRLRQLPMPKIFLRSAPHMENWGRVIAVTASTGTLPSLQVPVDGPHPTVSARDVGVIAASLLLDEKVASAERVVHVEGPRRYSANDVAAALSQLVGRTIIAQALPRLQWQETLERGMSAKSATLLIASNEADNAGGMVDVEPGNGETRHGTIEMIEALRPLVP